MPNRNKAYINRNINIKMKISEVSKFSILPCTQNRKHGSLGKYCFISNFDSSCNLRRKKDKKLTETKT